MDKGGGRGSKSFRGRGEERERELYIPFRTELSIPYRGGGKGGRGVLGGTQKHDVWNTTYS